MGCKPAQPEYIVSLLIKAVLLTIWLGGSRAINVYLSKDCWKQPFSCSLSVPSVTIPRLTPQQSNVARIHQWKTMHLMKDWNLTWVTEQQDRAPSHLAQLGKDATFLVSHKDGESISYHFLRNTARSHPYLRFILVAELSAASPITTALIIHEAWALPNVKLFSTQLGPTNLYAVKRIASQFVDSLYVMVITN